MHRLANLLTESWTERKLIVLRHNKYEASVQMEGPQSGHLGRYLSAYCQRNFNTASTYQTLVLRILQWHILEYCNEGGL